MKLLFILALATLGIIPAPKQCEVHEGFFKSEDTNKEYNIVLAGKESTDDFKTYLDLCGFQAGDKKAPFKFYIGAKYFKGTLPYGAEICEGYELTVTEKGVTVKAATTAGAFYALQTLKQIDKGGSIPCCKVVDEPAMAYRGLMFDVVRHYRGVEFICHQIDAMAALKMNRLHLHLTDSQAWRLKLDCHPEMVQTAFRPNIRMLPGEGTYVPEPVEYIPGTVNFEDGCYGGYFSKENIRQILEYARIRHIEVIPEIEMPGHSKEVLSIHPELKCSCEQLNGNSVCPGKEETFEFFQDVLAEVMELFPGKYVHVGGDEASKKNWEICPDCRRRMQEEGLASVEQLQSYMIGRIEKFINTHGKQMIGWDEIMQGGLCENATVMSWRGTTHGYNAISQGHDVVFSPNSYFYLDHYQGMPAGEPMAIGGNNNLRKVYFAPIHACEHLVGVQGNLWAEYITADKHYEYMLYPRAFAIAEIGWTQEALRGDYDGFVQRVKDLSAKFNDWEFAVRDVNRDIMMEDNWRPVKHLALGAKVDDPARRAKPEAAVCLTDGLSGTGSVGDSWYRIYGTATLTVDLGKECDIHYAGARFLHYRSTAAIPSNVEVLVSADGEQFRSIGRMWGTMMNTPSYDELKTRSFNPQTDTKQEYSEAEKAVWATSAFPFVCNESAVRYVRFVIVSQDGCPSMAVDELVVN